MKKSESANWVLIVEGKAVAEFVSRAAAREAKGKNPGNIVHIDSPEAQAAKAAPVEEAKVDEAKVDEAPVEETPVEETPASETATGLAAIALGIKKAPAKKLTHTTKKEKAPKPQSDPAFLALATALFADRPADEGPCATIRRILDLYGAHLIRKDVIAMGVVAGINKGTMSQQHHLWAKKVADEAKAKETPVDPAGENEAKADEDKAA